MPFATYTTYPPFPSPCLIQNKGCFSISYFTFQSMQFVIAQTIAWENPTTSVTSVTQLGVKTTSTLAISPLILVMDDSTTREASQVTLGRMESVRQGFVKEPSFGHYMRVIRVWRMMTLVEERGKLIDNLQNQC
jgi:hypothetical protein